MHRRSPYKIKEGKFVHERKSSSDLSTTHTRANSLPEQDKEGGNTKEQIQSFISCVSKRYIRDYLVYKEAYSLCVLNISITINTQIVY
eukprot:GAHX01000170.1.p1 GENE.GAHX01000170.1~~GAHX01000170.1.p1  ORF type:complete len:88 (-),score=5.99 GAHX01000170.1:326-589(-)